MSSEINDVDDLRGMLPYEIVGEVKRLTDALPDPGKLVALADWLDLKYPEEMGTGEVQADLRTWAYRAAAALGMDSIKRPDVLSTDEKIDALTTERDAATARAEALRGALEHIEAITREEMQPLYTGPRTSAADSAHKIAKCALLADGPEAPTTGREGEEAMRGAPVSHALRSTFGGQIKHRRQEAGLTYQQLADAAAISKSLLFEIEANNTTPSVFVAHRIAGVLGTTVDDLIRTGSPERTADRGAGRSEG